MTVQLHSVRIAAGGTEPRTIDSVQSFELTMDMLELADPFSISMPFRLPLWHAFATDSEVEIYIDDIRVMSGFVDRRERNIDRSGSLLEITGRDRGGRLVDESAPLGNFVNKGILELGKAMVSPWFQSVSLSNADNRRLLAGRGRSVAGVSSEPAIKPRSATKKVEPGETRAQVLQSFLEEAGLLAWSSADGTQFIIGKPNYGQETQYTFFQAAPQSSRAKDTNVLSMRFSEDVGEIYSEYEVFGAGKGNGANYGKNVLRRRGSAFDGFETGGTGSLFSHSKKLIISDSDVKSAAQARERAERELNLRYASANEITVTVPGWGQRYKGVGEPVLYAFDKIALLEDEESETSRECLITRVQFTESKMGGQVSTISMVPIGTELVFS